MTLNTTDTAGTLTITEVISNQNSTHEQYKNTHNVEILTRRQPNRLQVMCMSLLGFFAFISAF